MEKKIFNKWTEEFFLIFLKTFKKSSDVSYIFENDNFEKNSRL